MANVRVIPPREKEPTILRVAAYCRVSSDSSDQMNYYATLISGKESWTLIDL